MFSNKKIVAYSPIFCSINWMFAETWVTVGYKRLRFIVLSEADICCVICLFLVHWQSVTSREKQHGASVFQQLTQCIDLLWPSFWVGDRGTVERQTKMVWWVLFRCWINKANQLVLVWWIQKVKSSIFLFNKEIKCKNICFLDILFSFCLFIRLYEHSDHHSNTSPSRRWIVKGFLFLVAQKYTKTLLLSGGNAVM